jgi:GT2 family glycosyltransferase
MNVSVVIVSYNTCRILDECIASIRQETACAHEIIVVDNASRDNSCLLIRDKYPEVTLIENSENVGFAKANNQGFAIAKGKYFFMLNSDTVILDGAIDKLFGFMETNPDVGICGPRNIGRDGKLQNNCDHFPSFWNTFCYYSGLSGVFQKSSLFNRCWMRYWDYGELRDVDRMSGCSLLISSGLYRELSGLDENFFMYFEETDFCFRTQQKGQRITYLPDATIIHYGGESSKGNTADVVKSGTVWSYFYVSQYYYFRKNYGWFSMLAIRTLDLAYGMYLLFRSILRVDDMKRENDSSLGRFMVKMASNCN